MCSLFSYKINKLYKIVKYTEINIFTWKYVICMVRLNLCIKIRCMGYERLATTGLYYSRWYGIEVVTDCPGMLSSLTIFSPTDFNIMLKNIENNMGARMKLWFLMLAIKKKRFEKVTPYLTWPNYVSIHEREREREIEEGPKKSFGQNVIKTIKMKILIVKQVLRNFLSFSLSKNHLPFFF